MAITLDFYGGLFLMEESEDAATRIEVLLWRPQPIRVQVGGELDTGLGRLLTAAARLQFEGTPAGELGEDIPIRALSDVLPIDYDTASKTLVLNGAEMVGDGPPVTERAMTLFQKARSAEAGEEKLNAFRQLSGISGKDGPQFQAVAAEFFAQEAEELKYWQLGYHITLEYTDLRVLPSGQAGSSFPLPDDAHIVFDTEENSTIPHRPLNNPHVLERPPTRRGKRG